MTATLIHWPLLSENQPAPIWTGTDFLIGTERRKVLCYHERTSGWNKDLTRMHEDITGAHHYIDRASRQQAIDALAPLLKHPHPVLLEVGCSSGFFLEDLRSKAKHATLVGSDFIGEPLQELAGRLPGIPILQFDITHCPFGDSSFDGIVMLNVLEHIENDLEALKQVYRILKPGGLVVIEVPAGPHLYDFYDQHLMHYRRYQSKSLKSLAEKAGFQVERVSHLGFFLYPPFALVKKINRIRGKKMSESERQSKVSRQIRKGNTNRFMYALMKMELALGKYLNYPVGIRCLMTLKKQQGDQNVLYKKTSK